MKQNTIDMWCGDKFNPKIHKADCQFYPHRNFGYSYRGNIYDENGKVIGDYASNDSVWVGKTFGIEWR